MNTSEAAAKLLTSDEGTTVCYEVIKVNEAIALTLNVQLPCKYVGKCTFRTLQTLRINRQTPVLENLTKCQK